VQVPECEKQWEVFGENPLKDYPAPGDYRIP
jgi:hypothetical protein